MAGMRKTFRLFVSSTFSDMKAERNALQETVFPELKALCRSRGWDFSVVDLRWGVTDEAALDQQTMRICLEEVERCQATGLKPNFMILLGNRYGWVPFPAEVEKNEFENLRQTVTDAGDQALLDRWYRCDENALPAQYVLQPRLGERAAFADWGAWGPVETRLRQILQTAAAAAGLSPNQRRIYETSATEQEIHLGVFQVPDAAGHVHAFVRNINGLPAGVAARDFIDLGPDGSRDAAATARLESLRERLKAALPNTFHEYAADWTGSGVSTGHLENLCNDVRRSLTGLMETEFRQYEELEESQREALEHQAFAESISRNFVGRAEAGARIADYFSRDEHSPLGVIADAGLGKSSLLAHHWKTLRAGFPHAVSVVRFVGVTPGSTDIRSLLEGILREIARHDAAAGETTLESFVCATAKTELVSSVGATSPPEGPAATHEKAGSKKVANIRDGFSGEYSEMVKRFAAELGRERTETPLFLYIDGLDQLSAADRGRLLNWLPRRLGSGVRLVVSARSGTEPARILERLLPISERIHLTAMAPDEGEFLLDEWLKAGNRRVSADQKRAVAERFERQGNPLFLKLCFEECRNWRSYQGVPNLGTDISGVLEGLFARWSLRHGQLFLNRVMGYLAAARDGLSQDELMEVLAQDEVFYRHFLTHAHHDLPESSRKTVPASGSDAGPAGSGTPTQVVSKKQLPMVIFLRLYNDVQTFLLERVSAGISLLGFFYAPFAEFVKTTICRHQDRPDWHGELGDYFQNQPMLHNSGGGAILSVRRLRELPWQRIQSGDWPKVNAVLTDPVFLAAKTHAGLIFDLSADLDLARRSAPSEALNQTFAEFARFLQGQLYALKEHPELFYQQALNQPAQTAPAQTARRSLAQTGTPHLEWVNKPVAFDPCTLILTGHQDAVRCCSWSPVGQWLVSGGNDGLIKIWDPATGSEILTTRLEGETIKACAFSRDGSLVMAGTGKGTLVWLDGLSGAEYGRIAAHELAVNAVGFLPGNTEVFSISDDGTLKIFNLARGEMLRSWNPAQEGTENAGGSRLFAATLSSDGSLLAVGGEDRRIYLLDTGSWALKTLLEGTRGWIRCLAFDPAGTVLIGGTTDGKLLIWSLAADELQVTLSAHSDWVRTCAFSPDGRWFASGGADRRVCLWSASDRTLAQTWPGHADRVLTVGFAVDGSRLASGSADGALRLWDPGAASISEAAAHSTHPAIRSGHDLIFPEAADIGGHQGSVNAALLVESAHALLTASDDGTLKKWDQDTGKVSYRQTVSTDRLLCLQVSHDRRLAACGGTDQKIHVFRVGDGYEEACLDGHQGWVLGTAFLRGGGLVSVSADCSVRCWDLSKKSTRWVGKSHGKPVWGIDVSPDETLLLTTSDDATLKVWETASGTERKTLKGHADAVRFCRFSPDGSTAVSGALDGVLKLWAVDSWTARATIAAHRLGITLCRVFPDSTRLLTASEDGSAKIWNADTGAQNLGFARHQGPITAGDLSPDGTLAATASADGTVYLWAVDSGAVNGIWKGQGVFRTVRFSPAGKHLVCGDDAGRVFLLSLVSHAIQAPITVLWQGPAGWFGWKKPATAFFCPLCGFPNRVSAENAEKISRLASPAETKPASPPSLSPGVVSAPAVSAAASSPGSASTPSGPAAASAPPSCSVPSFPTLVLACKECAAPLRLSSRILHADPTPWLAVDPNGRPKL